MIMICVSCKAEIPEGTNVDSDGCVECIECGVWSDPEHPAVKRDVWLIEHGFEPAFNDDVLYGMATERDVLRARCITRQQNLCVVCGHGLYGVADVHEAICKRSDLPGDPRIFVEVNCVALHPGPPCHENTKRIDQICASYLIKHYGFDTIIGFIEFLEFKVLPGMAQEIINSSPGDF
jgi:hypothetical protein